jgi:glycine cleavage system H protein
MYPADRKYTKDFEWVKVVGAQALVGVTEYTLEALGDLVVIELPDVGRSLARNDACGSIESVKVVVELTAPVSGEVVEVNTALRESPKHLANDPYGTWVIKVKLKDPAELAALLSSKEVAALEQRTRESRHRAAKEPSAPERSKPASRPTAPVTQQRPPGPQVQPTIEERRNIALALQWSVQLRDSRLRGGDDAFSDRDYSGGSSFSWRQRDIVFTSKAVPGAGPDRRYLWRDTRWTRVSVAGLSSTTSTQTDYHGNWAIEVTSGTAYLVLQDGERGRLRYRLSEGARGTVLLDGRPYTLSRI